jgi:hypothetical protein
MEYRARKLLRLLKIISWRLALISQDGSTYMIDQFYHILINMVPSAGIEPATLDLEDPCSLVFWDFPVSFEGMIEKIVRSYLLFLFLDYGFGTVNIDLCLYFVPKNAKGNHGICHYSLDSITCLIIGIIFATKPQCP